MTVPEENRPKAQDTDDVRKQEENSRTRAQGGTGRTLREALEEADISPEDYDER